MNRIPALDRLGRRQRSQRNEILEDFFQSLQRLTIVHEKAAEDGKEVYSIQQRLEVEDE